MNGIEEPRCFKVFRRRMYRERKITLAFSFAEAGSGDGGRESVCVRERGVGFLASLEHYDNITTNLPSAKGTLDSPAQTQL
jgi:hypothetical protein